MCIQQVSEHVEMASVLVASLLVDEER